MCAALLASLSLSNQFTVYREVSLFYDVMFSHSVQQTAVQQLHDQPHTIICHFTMCLCMPFLREVSSKGKQ